ncbi:hypothetical protein [Rhodopseudomonas telluris]|uniref:Uncharacterized protein n=1 Tax=Rhodopseudomonas telluris TaxID=644215 RepID=A0ABV6EPF8_9BRAD
MPLAAQGMLLTSMDIDAADECDFNRWYDREHLAERVAIDGFLEARRYVALDAVPKYLALYATATFDVLSSPAYRMALANQTEWSNRNIAKFKNMIRGVARITASHGQGRGAILGLVRLRPRAGNQEHLRSAIFAQRDLLLRNGLVSMHLLENDPALSRPLTDPPRVTSPGASDWFVVIEGTDRTAVRTSMTERFESTIGPELISTGVYALLWDLTKSDLSVT